MNVLKYRVKYTFKNEIFYTKPYVTRAELVKNKDEIFDVNLLTLVSVDIEVYIKGLNFEGWMPAYA